MENQKSDDEQPPEKENSPISNSLSENFKKLQSLQQSGEDVIIRKFNMGNSKKPNAVIAYIEGLTNRDLLENKILKPLMYFSTNLNASDKDLLNMDFIENNLLLSGNIKRSPSYDALIDKMFYGNIILLIEGLSEGFIINAFDAKTRAIEEPKTETTIRGPREGFVELLRTNITLIRRKIRNPDLCFENMIIGKRSKTEISIAYIKGIADKALIDEIKKRLSKINNDAIIGSGYIEQFIEDAPLSIFPTISNCESPDKLAAKMLEGRAAILVDGTPFVLCVPMLFVESFQRTEDYYSRPYFTSIIRLLRFLSYIITIFAPASYVALSTFHQELIPTKLILTLSAGHARIPFPTFWEALLILIIFDILREASVALPRPVGSAVTIVGALVLGQSAVSAGILGPFMVIVVSITAIAGFVVTSQTGSITILRYLFLILAGISGGFGIILGIIAVGIHLASLKSFGVPYLSPIGPLSLSGQKDVFVRFPLWSMVKRPKLNQSEDLQRVDPGSSHEPLGMKKGEQNAGENL